MIRTAARHESNKIGQKRYSGKKRRETGYRGPADFLDRGTQGGSRVICAITCNDARSLIGVVSDPSVWVQLRDNGRSLSARYWPIVAGERAGTALPTAARSDTGSTASVTRPFSTCRQPNRIPNAACRESVVNDKRRISNDL